jgi:hypothetical protein
MRVALITEKTIKKEVSQSFLKHYAESVIFDLEKNISSKLLDFRTFILISKTILNRKNLKLKKIVSLANRNNIKLIEVAFEKSNLSEEQSKSDAIIHGFNNHTIEVIKKVIDSLK